ncbi:uridine diphosphate-N-acetylglucosamine-binding protein YvcK [Holzapfeliella sp. He02]|uniref:Putative gluconeogenesis factor n=1 Tax=Holzapfeliella saturejae TaxID=3082953 RepID=A0ABU8SFR3_9LACO
MSAKKVVVIGGGTGLSVILNSLKDSDVELTAVVTVSDDGGSSGIIRDYINVVPPGDIRNVMVALSTLPQDQLELFQYRFKSQDDFFSGHALGNLIIAALSEMTNDMFEAIQYLSHLMKVDGNVYPVSNSPLILNAQFEDGTVESGESHIVTFDKQIKTVWVTDPTQKNEQPKAVSEVVDAIHEADMVILGPGSLFTSILPNVVIPNVRQALAETKANITYICNIMTQAGETECLTDYNHLEIINRHLKTRTVDTVLVNNRQISPNVVHQNSPKGYLKPVEHDEISLLNSGVKIISGDFLDIKNKNIYHDGVKVRNAILDLL